MDDPVHIYFRGSRHLNAKSQKDAIDSGINVPNPVYMYWLEGFAQACLSLCGDKMIQLMPEEPKEEKDA